MAKYGFTAVNQNLNKNTLAKTNLPIISDASIKVGRVTSISLDPNKPNELGNITYVNVSEVPQDESQVVNKEELLIAKPLYTNLKNYPLINELVLLVYQPDTGLMSNTQSKSTYYMSVLSIWNHPHHNAIPQYEGNLQPSQKKSYVQTLLGSPVKTTNKATEINLGNTFIERPNIHPLLPFEGDVIWEGRWGNSLRFGSTNILVTNDTKVTPKTDAFYTTYNFGLGETTPSSTFNSELSFISAKIKNFQTQYNDVSIIVSLIAGESQVTNPNNAPSGTLANQRLENLKKLLLSYPLINVNPISNTVIGYTPYIPGVNNPNDPRYLNEQFITVNVSVRGNLITKQPIKTVPLNNWSSGSINGDPITILRNGQGNQKDEGWSPIVENINNDNSSIYLTSTQNIPLIASSTNYFSYSTEDAPITPNQYTNNQIILNSGRLLFNSTSDHILLSSAKSISLSSLNSVNIDSSDLIVQSNKMYLGSKNATEPLLLGNQTVELLNQLITNLDQFMKVCSKLVGTEVGVPLVPLNAAAEGMSNVLDKLKGNLENLKSKDNFTI